MAPMTARPKDSTAEESYQIGDKVYFYKGEGWRQGRVINLDSEFSSNPVYHIKDEEDESDKTPYTMTSDKLAKRTKS
ncbi:MAG: hypothetical protein ASARMPRED_002947 [Alectoria sarmentosa]|nr:MAG: hypothetical protein ASARMPRED_002947 [Alectoria sarmentosa]